MKKTPQFIFLFAAIGCGCAAKSPHQISHQSEKMHPARLVAVENEEIKTSRIGGWECIIHYGPGTKWESDIAERTVADVWARLIGIFQASEKGTLDVYIVSGTDWKKLPFPFSMLGGIPYSMPGKNAVVLPTRDIARATFYELFKTDGYVLEEDLSEKQFYSNFVAPLIIHELTHSAVSNAFKQREDDLGFSLGLNETIANIGLALATDRQSHHWPFYFSVHKQLLKSAPKKPESPLPALIRQPLREGTAVYGLFQAMSLDFADKLCQEIRPDEVAHIFDLLKGSDRKALDAEFVRLVSAAGDRLRDNGFLIAISTEHAR